MQTISKEKEPVCNPKNVRKYRSFFFFRTVCKNAISTNYAQFCAEENILRGR